MDADEFFTTIEALRQENASLSRQNEELRRLASFPQLNPNPVMEFNRQGQEIFLNSVARQTLSQLDLADARPFLPDDFASISTSANENLALPYFREVKIGDRYFEEAIYYSQQYDSFRIYAYDITDRMQAKKLLEENRQALKHMQDLLEAVTKGTEVIIAAVDTDFCYTYFNEAYQEQVKRLCGKDIHIGTNIVDTFAHMPDQQKVVVEEWSQVLRGESTHKVLEFGDPGIHRRVYNVLHTPLRNAQGNLVGAGEVAYDITDQVKIQESLRQSEVRYRSLFEGMTEGFAIHEIILDENGKSCDYRFLEINPAFERLTGLRREMVIGKTYRQVLPDEGDSWVNLYGNVVLTGEPAQFENYSPSLGRYFEVFAYRCAPDQFAVIFLDITDLKKMENDLRINLAKYSALFDSLPLGVTVSDRNGQLIESNQEATRLLGLSEAEQKSRQIDAEQWEIIRPDRTRMPPDEFASVRAIKENRRIDNVEMGLVKGEDQITWISVSATPLPIEGHGVVIAYNDISRRIQVEEELHRAQAALEITNKELKAELAERKRTEKVLQATQQILQTVVEHMPVAVTLIRGSDLRLQLVNPAYQAIAPGKEMVGHTLDELWPETGQTFADICRHVLDTGEPYQAVDELNMVRRLPDGPLEPAYFTWSMHRVRLPGDQGWGLLNTAQETTKRKQMEMALSESQRRYQDLIETTSEFIWEMDCQARYTYCSPQMETLWGIKPQEMIGKTPFDVMPPEEKEKALNNFMQVVGSALPFRGLTSTAYNSQGQLIFIETSGVPFFDHHGGFLGFRGITRDITERIQAEEMLRNAYAGLEQRVRERTQELFNTNQELIAEIEVRKRVESQLVIQTKAVESERQRFNDVLEILPAYLILLTPDYHVSFANRYFRERFGEDQGRCCYEYLFRRSEPCENCETYTVLRTGKPHHWEWTGPDGHNYDVFDFPFPDIDGSTLILEMGIDITKRKQAEEKLRLLNAYNRSLIEANLDALITITADGKIGDVNSVTEAITGLTREELIGTDFHSYFTDPQKAQAGYQQVFKTGSVRDYELEIRRKDGHTTPVIYNASIYHDESGHVTGVFAAARDITERKQAERQLVLLTTALEAAANGIIVTDVNGSILWSNPAFSRMTGFSYEEIIGQNPRFLRSGAQDPIYYQELWNTILAGEVWHGELINQRKDGSVYYEEQIITPVFDQDTNITNFISIKQDITEHKFAEQQLERQNEELLALSDAERRQRELAEGLVESVKILSSSLQLEDVLNSMLDQIRRTVPFRGADIILIEGKTFHVAGYRGFEDLPDSLAAMQRKYALEDFPLFQRMCVTLQPVLVPHTVEEPDWRVAAGMEWVRSYLAVPLITDGQVIGVMNLTSDQPGFFNPETAARLMAFTDHAALALHNAQLYKAALTARQVAETLSTAARALTQTLDLDEIFNTLLEHVGALIHPDMAGIALLEGETRLVIRSMRSFARPVEVDRASLGVVDTDSLPLLKKLLSGHESILILDTATIPGWQVPGWAEGLHTWLGMPLVASDKVIGIIGLGKTEKDSFTPEQVQWAEALVGQAAMAIQNAWLFQQVRASSERLQGLSRRLVEVQENERRYIASELHDEVGQALTTLIVQLQLIESRAEQPEAVRAEVAAMSLVLDSVIENLHRLAMDLRPASLDYLGLEAALRQHVDLMSTKLGLEIQFAMTGITERLPASIEIAFYRIVQEALNNVVRHSHAKHADVLITQRDGYLVVIIEDNGVGFNPEEAFKGKRIGLEGMRERAEMLGGKLLVESVPGQGSTILVEVPYASPNSYR